MKGESLTLTQSTSLDFSKYLRCLLGREVLYGKKDPVCDHHAIGPR